MREIAQAQAAVGLTAELFEAFAHVWADVANTPLAEASPSRSDTTSPPETWSIA